MKIDRLLGITMYLLNRDTVNAKTLAEKFEVSVRTIQRDIETLNLAKIPIVSTCGTDGGYEIIDDFKLNKQITNSDDYLYILTALKGLCSAYDNKKLDQTLEKIIYTSADNNMNQKMFLDFSVLREGNDIGEAIKIIEDAVDEKKIIEFDYTNADNHAAKRDIEPLALTYIWYSWYLFGYCLLKKDYRLFKLTRIKNILKTNKSFSIIHDETKALLNRQQNQDTRNYFNIKLLCKSEIKTQVQEYLHGEIINEQENGDFIMSLHLPENERMWFSIILGFGNKVKVLEPEELQIRITETAKEILTNYNKL